MNTDFEIEMHLGKDIIYLATQADFEIEMHLGKYI